MKTPKLTDVFIAYCRHYTAGKERDAPLNKRTVERYIRGLNLVKKIVGHGLETVTDADQLIFIEGITQYKQGTRRVSTQIFQRYVAWGRKNGYFTCDNILLGKESEIIGEYTPPSYQYAPRSHIERFFQKLKTPQFRMVFALVYYGGLTTSEVAYVTKDNISKEGLFVYRAVRKESQSIPLPRFLMVELRQWAETREDKLFDLGDNLSSRHKINSWFKQAQLETQELIGFSLRDFRTTGIRHFYELCQDLELTKEFAGVSDKKGGWLNELVDVSSYYRKNVSMARSYYGKPEQHEPRKER